MAKLAFIFYAFKPPSKTGLINGDLGDGYHVELWRPSLLKLIPPDQDPFVFSAWWMIHNLKLFKNRDYAVLMVQRDGRIIHRSLITPGYFRFPFMAAGDLQIGDLWTAPEYRCYGLATAAIQYILFNFWRPNRCFWYVAEQNNIASRRVVEKLGFVEAGQGNRVNRWGIGILGHYQINSNA